MKHTTKWQSRKPALQNEDQVETRKLQRGLKFTDTPPSWCLLCPTAPNISFFFFFFPQPFVSKETRRRERKSRESESQVRTHWESAARLRLPWDPAPPSMSAAEQERRAAGSYRGSGLAVRVWARSSWRPCYLWLKCSAQDAPGSSLCVNTLVCPCDESLGLSSAKSTPPHPFPSARDHQRADCYFLL